MRYIIAGFLALFLIGLGEVVWGQAQAQAVCDYVPPESQLSALALSGDYRYFNDRSSSDTGNVNIGHLAAKGFIWAEEGPDWSYSVNGSARMELPPAGITVASLVESEGDLRRYLQEDLFVFGGGDTIGLPTQQGLTVSVLGGAGWGRFRNVTPLAQALQVLAVLRQENVLTSAEVSPDMVQKLSQLIGRQRELGIPGVLQNIEDLLGVSLDVSAVLALQDVLSAEATHFCGWDVSAAVGYELIDPTGENNVILRAQTNYAQALDTQSELLARATLRTPLPWAGTYLLNASVGYDRTLSPTADLTTMYSYVRTQAGTEIEAEEIHALDSLISLALQANLNLLLKIQATWGTGFEELEWGFDVGFEYDLF